jgi:amino acid transporter
MFTVSGTTVGVVANIDAPALDDWLPTSAGFCGVIIATGAISTLVAALGISIVTILGKAATPVLIAGIIFMCVRSLIMLGLGEDGNSEDDMKPTDTKSTPATPSNASKVSNAKIVPLDKQPTANLSATNSSVDGGSEGVNPTDEMDL